MLTLDSTLRFPAYVSFTIVEEDAILLNTHTDKYFALNDVGARLWNLLSEGKLLKECHQVLLQEYEVDSAQLEQDILELLEQLRKHDLVEIIQI
jgi:hypothetical protein